MSLTPIQIATWTLEMTIKYGVPAVQQLISAWSDDIIITKEMVHKLENDMKKPEDYFGEEGKEVSNA